MDRDTFIFHKKWYEAIKGLDDKTKAAVFDRICQYAIYYNTEDVQDPIVNMAMSFITPDLKVDCEKWIGTREKRSEAGKKHKGNQHTKKEQYGTNGTNEPSVPTLEQDGTNGTVYVLQEDNINSNITSMCNTNNISSLSPKVDNKDSSHSDDCDAGICFQDLISFWNETFKNTCIKQLSSINGNRRRLTTARIKEFGKDKFAEAIRKAASSKFVTSGEFRNFDYDWFIKPNNFPKVLEGKYNDVATNIGATQIVPADKTIDYQLARDRYFEGDRSIVWFGTDSKHMLITTEEIAKQYGVPYKPFKM